MAEKTVANFFKPASQKQPDKVTWRVRDDTLIIGRYQPSDAKMPSLDAVQKHKIALFDLVGLAK